MHREAVESCRSNVEQLSSTASSEEVDLWRNVMAKSLHDLCDWEHLSTSDDHSLHFKFRLYNNFRGKTDLIEIKLNMKF